MRKIFAFLLLLIIAMPSMGATLINDTETERVIGKLVAPLARAANIPDGRTKIHIVNDDDFNAFVMGGEDIYVYTGLLKQIKTHLEQLFV